MSNHFAHAWVCKNKYSICISRHFYFNLQGGNGVGMGWGRCTISSSKRQVPTEGKEREGWGKGDILCCADMCCAVQHCTVTRQNRQKIAKNSNMSVCHLFVCLPPICLSALFVCLSPGYLSATYLSVCHVFSMCSQLLSN